MKGVGPLLAAAAEAVHKGDIILISASEFDGRRLAALMEMAAPDQLPLFLPASDAIPGTSARATPENAGQRVATLNLIRTELKSPQRRNIALILTTDAAARLYPAPDRFDDAPPRIAAGDAISPPDLAQTLRDIGYLDDERVDEPGEIAAHGKTLDVYPVDSLLPIRIEFDGDMVADIRSYDPITQLSDERLTVVELGHLNEPRMAAGGVPITRHLAGASVILAADADRQRQKLLRYAHKGAADHVSDIYLDDDRWRQLLQLSACDLTAQTGTELLDAPLSAPEDLMAAALAAGRSVVVAGSARDLRFLRTKLAPHTLDLQDARTWYEAGTAKDSVQLLELPLRQGWQTESLLVIAAADILGGRAETETERQTRIDPLQDAIGSIRIGDVVVHEDHGLGQVSGIEPMPVLHGEVSNARDMSAGDAIVLTFAKGGRRLVAVKDAGLLWRYGGDADSVKLDRLNGKSWAKRRLKVSKSVAETAKSLIAIAERRGSSSADAWTPEQDAVDSFADGFPFSETADQMRAISAVSADLASTKSTDRLIVGDVGFGKTEIALRAAAQVALAGGQVALAAPTTLLVRQHAETFAARFAGTGIRIANLSRLTTPAEKRRVRAGLADGSIDIVIGTASVAAKTVTYVRLGLVIIDEEQRFGTKDKAKLAALMGDGGGHRLSLSATPIPRTLAAAMIGLQDISVIATPPLRRQPISTRLAALSPELVKAALLREKARGGQSFVVVPRVKDIEPMRGLLRRAVPDMTIRTAHGKMAAAELDSEMMAFSGGDGDILLATNIIESGLDVPRANLMIVNRADRFGLAQLHQLRGRVGRGAQRGRFIMTVKDTDTLAPATEKRLRTLQAFDRLGAGFAISAQDLGQRGAGDLTGEDQAGHTKLIGIDLYQFLLESALRRARGEDVDRALPAIDIGLAGHFPKDWIQEDDIRLALYCRLARLETTSELEAFKKELSDRFGEIPHYAQMLMTRHRLVILAHFADIARIKGSSSVIAFETKWRKARKVYLEGLTQKSDRFLLSIKGKRKSSVYLEIERVLVALSS